MTTDFLGFEKPSKDDRINIDVLNDNTDEIDKHFERTSIVLSVTDNNISVDATGPYYTVTNNNADTVQALLEGNSMLLDPGETFKMNKDATETFTLEVTCASDVTVTYFQRNKDYVDGSLASNLTNYYDKTDSDSIFLKTEDFSDMRNEESSSVCSVDLPLKYNAIGNPVEEYRIHGDTPQQTGAVSPDFPKPVSGTGDLITDEQSEHYGKYALPIINNGVTYNAYLTSPLYRVSLESDYIDYARQKVIRKAGVIVYDGSADEEWANTEYQEYRIALENLGGGTDASYPYYVLCDKLTKTSASGVGIWDDRIAICGGYVYVHFDDTMTDVTTFKTYLQSNPITVYYPLASEVTEDVMLPELPTISGENQLYVDTTELPKNVVVGALMQYLTRKDMNDTFPGLDNVYTKLEVNSMVNSLNAEVVTKAESVNDINQINGNISLTLDDVPDGDGRKMAGLATEAYVNSAIGNVNSFNVLVVQSLPTVDIQQHTIYFVPKTPSENGDVYDEYMYINSAWEHIGTSEADLSSYYTKSEVNTAISNKADSTVLTAHTSNADIHVTAADKTAWNGALISKADTTTVNTALDLKANLTDLDEVDNKTVFIGRVEPARTSALWIQNNVSISITETEFINLPQTNFIYTGTMSIGNQPDGNYGILYVPIESNAKYRICKQAGHSFRIGTTTSIPKTGTVVNYTAANHTGDQITITTGNTDKYLVIIYWNYTNDPETTKGQMRSTITIDEIGNPQIHYLDNGNYLPLITSDTAIKSQPRNLIGKNILFIGDSITEKNYRTAKNYHDYLAEWFGFKNINKGVSGTGYMDNETFGLGWYNKLLNGFYPSTGVDGIVIMGAINDRYHSVGTYGDSTATTLFGTLKLMYEELITRYPKIPILIITSTPRRYSYGDSGNDGTLANYHGHVDAVIQMAKEYSFPCFDLYRNSGLRPWNTTNNTEYFTADGTGVETGPRDADGVHPNSKGHKIMAQKLFEFINSGLNL